MLSIINMNFNELYSLVNNKYISLRKASEYDASKINELKKLSALRGRLIDFYFENQDEIKMCEVSINLNIGEGINEYD